MSVRNFNDAEKQKLIQIINQGSQVLGECDDLKSLRLIFIRIRISFLKQNHTLFY